MALSRKALFHDIRALGSWTFYLLVIARASIDLFRPFLDHLLIAGAILLTVSYFVPYDGHVARALTAAMFTTLFYNTLHFTIFVALIMLVLAYASFSISNRRKVWSGIAYGSVASGAAYLIVGIYI